MSSNSSTINSSSTISPILNTNTDFTNISTSTSSSSSGYVSLLDSCETPGLIYYLLQSYKIEYTVFK